MNLDPSLLQVRFFLQVQRIHSIPTNKANNLAIKSIKHLAAIQIITLWIFVCVNLTNVSTS